MSRANDGAAAPLLKSVRGCGSMKTKAQSEVFVNRLGAVVLSLVGAGISLFALSVLSRPSPSEIEIRSGSVLERGEEGDEQGRVSGPRAAGDQGRQAVAATRGGFRADGGTVSSEPGRRSVARSGSAAVGAGSSVARGGSNRTGEPGGGDSSGSAAGRRGHLVDFLADEGHVGGEAGGRVRGGSSGKASTAGGWEVASAQGEGEPVDANGDGVVDPEEAGEDVVLSVPLDDRGPEGASTEPIVDEGLEVEDDGVDFPADSVLAFPDAGNMRGEAGTIAFEVEPKWNGTDPGDNSFVQVRSPGEWQGKVSLFRNGRFLRFVWFDTDGQETGVGVDISEWQAGDRHEVTATWGEALLSVYIDGQLAGQNTYSGELAIAPGTPLFLGSNPQHHVPGADATLQNFKVYGRALSPDEVRGGLPASAGAPKATN